MKGLPLLQHETVSLFFPTSIVAAKEKYLKEKYRTWLKAYTDIAWWKAGAIQTMIMINL
ncbi:MAG TPA: hypothetical protein VIM16_11485 [Mucilaginibacter sp.]|jgi:hypothetical protein